MVAILAGDRRLLRQQRGKVGFVEGFVLEEKMRAAQHGTPLAVLTETASLDFLRE